MINLAQREVDILGALKDFQRATVERVVDCFRRGQSRVLVADEVGLGKTLIAKGVIASMAHWRHQEGLEEDGVFRVVYICSNQSIARQNIMKLKIDEDVLVDMDSETRLTMQTLKYFRQICDPRLQDACVHLIPLTPNTSFATVPGQGMKAERALVYAILRRLPAFISHNNALSHILSMGVKDWHWWSATWVEDRITECGDAFTLQVVPGIAQELETGKYQRLYHDLLEACQAIEAGDKTRVNLYQLVHRLRLMMADISVSYLEPDLVIMDEFQRFRELIRTDEQSEIGLLARKFLHNPRLKVLLLSATPYKLYATLDEIADQHGEDDHYREFDEVVSFLYGEQTKARAAFQTAWVDYSLALHQLGRISPEAFQQRKARVEEMLYAVMCRTERLQVTTAGHDIIDTRKAAPVPITQADIAAFMSADQVVNELAKKERHALPPVEYVKSAPYIFSFMERYLLKRYLKKHQAFLSGVLKKSTVSWLPRNQVEQYQKIEYPNARLQTLMTEAFERHAEYLLWVPPVLPYYQFGGKFRGSEGFSKILVFSAWEMVPRMLATLVSYEAERRTIGDPNYQPKNETVIKRYTPPGKTPTRFPSGRLDFRPTLTQDHPESMSLFCLLYPSRFLADIFQPVEMLQQAGGTFPLSRKTVEAQLRSQLDGAVEKLLPYQKTTTGREDAAWYWAAPVLLDVSAYGKEQVATWVQQLERIETGEEQERELKGKLYLEHLSALRHLILQPSPSLGKMPRDLQEVLLRQVLGSSAVCALRTLLQELHSVDPSADELHCALHGAHEIALALRNKFNLPEGTAIVDLCYRESGEFHWKNVLRYGVDGNLQAVLDEYSHMLVDSYGLRDYSARRRVGDLAKLISQSLKTTTASYKVDTYAAFTRGDDEGKGLRMRSHYAAGFYNIRSSDQRDVQRTDQLRQAFNSPFWPFVLASTSIGQEGLDFHYYCRKIVHWNLPANPIDLEQREGRINRYKGLAIRQSAAQRYQASGGITIPHGVWDALFDYCQGQEKGEQCDLIPFWYLEPPAGTKGHGVIERIVPLYPFSKDVALYDRLVKILSLYRITMGQPRQEELLQAIAPYIGKTDPEAMKRWFILLSPYYRQGG